MQIFVDNLQKILKSLQNLMSNKLVKRFPVFEFMEIGTQIAPQQIEHLEQEIELPHRLMSKKSKQIWRKIKSVEELANSKFKTNKKLYKALSKTLLSVGLSLNSQQIESLQPFQNRKFKVLQTLNLGDNSISSLDSLLSVQMENLQSFEINHNNLTMFKQLQEVKWPKLKILSLSQNQIFSIEPLIRCNFMLLQILNISDNYISNIKSLAHLTWKHLRQIDLSSNQIKQIHDLSKMSLNNLQILDLRQNFILETEQIEKIKLKDTQLASIIFSIGFSNFDTFKRKIKSRHARYMRTEVFKNRIRKATPAKMFFQFD